MKLIPAYKILLASALISCMGFFANAYSTSYYKSTSKLNTGHWVKIKVSNVGMHQITYTQLQEMGFSDPSKVSVYGYGGALLSDNSFHSNLPDDLPVQPVYRTDDKIIFYGEGDVRYDLGSDAYTAKRSRNPYSIGGYYFLSDSKPGDSDMPTTMSYNSSASTNITYHNSLQYVEQELTCPAKAGSRFFGKDFKDEEKQIFKFNAPDPYDTETYTGGIRYEFAANATNSFSFVVDTIDMTPTYVSHREVQAITKNSKIYYTTKDGIIKFMMRENPDSIVYEFPFSIPKSKKYNYVALDYVTFAYYRKNNIAGYPQLRMVFREVNSSNYFTLEGTNSNIQVWNVSSPYNVFSYETRYNDTNKTMSATFEKKYSQSSNGHAYIIAFDPSQELYPVEYAGEVNNQNIHSMKSPDMLVITNKSMRKYAEEIAQAHRDLQGMTVYVFDQEEVFNEFSSGTPAAMAYRRLAKMFYDRNSSQFKYLMLFGGGSFDNRGILMEKKDNLLTYQCEDIYEMNSPSSSYCADSYFGMLNDNFSLGNIHIEPMLIGVGRIPVIDETDARSVTSKIVNYLKNPPLNIAANKALLLADDGDYNGHQTQVEEVCDTIQYFAPHVTINKVYNALYPWTSDDAAQARDAIVQALSNGVNYFGFTGHGVANSFAREILWHNDYVESTDYSVPPITMLATCDVLSFDRLDNGIGETLLYKENGGAIAVVGSCRTVYKDYNQFLNLSFAAEVYSASETDCIGDAYRRAHNSAATAHPDQDLGINTLCYNLAGDPAIPLYIPTLKVKTAKINDVTVSNDDTSTLHTIYPLAKNIIEGIITDCDGNAIDSFNGIVTLTVYDAPIDQSIYLRESTDKDSIVTRNEDILTETTVKVINGTFKAEIIIPESLRPEIANHITYYALSNDKAQRANGIFNQVSISRFDSEKAINDTTAPIISEFYLNEPTFANGDQVESDIMVYATIQPDESGLNKTTATIGVATKLILDGVKSYPYVRGTLITDMDGYTTIKFPINELEDGKHSLTLSVADNAGNRTERTLSFVVINREAQATLLIDEEPARTEANFSLTHNFKYEPKGRLVIEDAAGNTVFTKENCTYPYTWNLLDNAGNQLPDGNYNCYTILNANMQYCSTPKARLIILKK